MNIPSHAGLPAHLTTLVEQLLVAAQASDQASALKQILPPFLSPLTADYMAVVEGTKGTWRVIAATSSIVRTLPTDLLAEAIDSGNPVTQKTWKVFPLRATQNASEALLLFSAKGFLAEGPLTSEIVAAWLDETLASVRQHASQKLQIARLEEILKISASWQKTHETSSLLLQIAEAATRLLDAQRATIFFWDKASKTLVGKPALGVKGNELRIPEDTGVVGQVVRTGQPRRIDVDIASDQREVDRRVDKQLQYETQTVVCVPMRSKSGEIIGAFEALNCNHGNFTDSDLETLAELAVHAALALQNVEQLEQLAHARARVANQAAAGVQMIGSCPAIVALRSTIQRVADTELSVLILGENGTGKEVVSQSIHYQSRRRQEPFIAVNCAALTETLLESELFGHEKGAFTDAREMRRGKFEIASGGTLLLDEIGDMSLAGQAKLLRVLEDKVVVRIGGSLPIKTDVRVLAATNQNLPELVRQKRFREDLFFRLSVVTMDLPPLRSRGEDILELAEHFLETYATKARRKVPKFTAAARKALLSHTWPGNVRELRNLMEQLAYLTPEEQIKIDAEDLRFVVSPLARTAQEPAIPSGLTLAEATRRFQIQLIRKQADLAKGNMTLAAERLGLHRSNLYRKMQQLDMEVTDDS